MSRLAIAMALSTVAALGLCGWWMLQPTEPLETVETATATTEATNAKTEPTAKSPSEAVDTVTTQPLPSMDLTPKEGVISGTVWRPDGRIAPEAKIRISLSIRAGDTNYSLVKSFKTTATSDAEGRFSAEVPGGGVYRLIGLAKGFGPAQLEAVPPGEVVKLTLQPAATLEGRILEEATGATIEGVEVEAKLGKGLPTRKMKSGPNGSFLFEDLPAGELTLQLYAPEHVDPEPLLCEARRGERTDDDLVFFNLDRGKRIKGNIREREMDLPLAGAVVEIGRKRGIADESGDFVVGGLPSRRVEVRARADGFLPQTRNITLSGSREEAEVKFVLKKGACLYGRITDPDGNPVENAKVRLHQSWGRSSSYSYEDWATRFMDIRSDKEGNYEFPGIEARSWGNYLLVVNHEDWPNKKSDTFKIKRTDERTPMDVRFDFGGALKGQVLDENRQVLAGVRVSLRLENSYSSRDYNENLLVSGTDEEGRFIFHGLADGQYTVSVTAKDYSQGIRYGVKIKGGRDGDHQEFVLVRGTPLTGICFDDKDQPISGVKVRVWTRKGSASATSEEDGTFTMEAVPEGPWRVTASKEGWGRFHKRKMTADKDSGLRIEMKRQALFRGRAISASSKEPLRAFTVTASTFDNQRNRRRQVFHRRFRKSTDGRFTVQVKDGKYDVEVRSQGHVREVVKNVEFKAGDEVDEKEFALREGGAIEGYLKMPDGRPCANARIYRRGAFDEDDGYLSITNTEFDGYFYLGDLEAGDHDVAATYQNYPLVLMDRISVGNSEGEPLDLRISTETSLKLSMIGLKRPRKPTIGIKSPYAKFYAAHRRYNKRRMTVKAESLDNSLLGLVRKGRSRDGSRRYRKQTFKIWSNTRTRTTQVKSLPPGRYRITATFPDLPPIVRDLSLGYGSKESLVFDFNKHALSLHPDPEEVAAGVVTPPENPR